MTIKSDGPNPLTELDHLVSAWGGDPRRWPDAVRLRIATLSAASPEAARLLAEARALDRLLDTARDAPAPLSQAKALSFADRIVTAATATTQPAATGSRDNVVVLRLTPRAHTAPIARSNWQAAGLMAACLMAGMYIGGTFNMMPLLQELADTVGLSTGIDPAIAALSDDLSDEDML